MSIISDGFTLTRSHVIKGAAGVTVFVILLGVHFAWTSVGLMKAQLEAQKTQLEHLNKQDKEKVEQMWAFLVKVDEEQRKAQEAAASSEPQPSPTK